MCCACVFVLGTLLARLPEQESAAAAAFEAKLQVPNALPSPLCNRYGESLNRYGSLSHGDTSRAEN